MQIGQRLAIVERAHRRHEAGKQVENPVGLGDNGGKRLPPVAALSGVAALDERAAGAVGLIGFGEKRSEENTSELQSLMRISYAVFCLKKKKTKKRDAINIRYDQT